MKEIKGGDIVVLTSGQTVNFPNGHDSNIIFKKGSICKVMGISKNNEEIISITVQFLLCYGIGLNTTVKLTDVRKATSDEIHCFCGYNNQTLN